LAAKTAALRLTSTAALPTLRGPEKGQIQAEIPSVANTKSAEKAARQAVKHRATNVASRSRLRSAIRKSAEASAAGNKDGANAAFKAAVPVIDAMVNKGLIHRNKAARHKSRLAARAKAAAGK
jgi:small subunit ribosomal protein S20